MMRLTLVGLTALTALTVVTAGLCGTADQERQRLVSLFKNVQDVLLTINSEIIQYSERFDDLSSRLQDRKVWSAPVLEQDRLLPQIRELNRLKLAVSLIGTGLEKKYVQLKDFQRELKDRYPHLQMEIDYYYNMFDKVYDDSKDRHKQLNKDLDDLKAWFKGKVASRVRERESQSPEVARSGLKKRRGSRTTGTHPPARLQPSSIASDQERALLGKIESRTGAPPSEEEP